jgi:hypothetical protein
MKAPPKTKLMQATIDKLWDDLKKAQREAGEANTRAQKAEADMAQMRDVLKMTRTPVQRLYEIILDADPAQNVFSPAFARHVDVVKKAPRHNLAAQVATLGADSLLPRPLYKDDTPNEILDVEFCPVTGKCERKPQCVSTCYTQALSDMARASKQLIDGE